MSDLLISSWSHIQDVTRVNLVIGIPGHSLYVHICEQGINNHFTLSFIHTLQNELQNIELPLLIHYSLLFNKY